MDRLVEMVPYSVTDSREVGYDIFSLARDFSCSHRIDSTFAADIIRQRNHAWPMTLPTSPTCLIFENMVGARESSAIIAT